MFITFRGANCTENKGSVWVNHAYHMLKLVIKKDGPKLKFIQEKIVELVDKGVKGSEAVAQILETTGIDVNHPATKDEAAQKAVELVIPSVNK